MSTTRQVNCNIAALKLIAMFGVICLHTFGSLNPIDSRTSYVLWYFVTFSIPVFFAASGYFMLNRSSKLKTMLSKVVGIVALILMWGGVFMLYKYALQIHYHHTLMPTKEVIEQPFVLTLLSIFQQGRFGRLWFMWALANLYLLSPLFSKAFKDPKTAVYLALALTGICILSHVIDVAHILTTKTSMYSYDVNPWFRQTFKVWVFAAYFVWGGVLGREGIKEAIRKRISQKAAVALMIILMLLSVVYQMALDSYMVYNSPEYQHDSPLIILWVLSILVVATCYETKSSDKTVWKDISECTLGIYFLHGMIAFLLKYLVPATSLFNLIVLAFLTFTVCYVITVVSMKIPIAKAFMNIPKIKIAR